MSQCPHCGEVIDIILKAPTLTSLEKTCEHCKEVHKDACWEDAPETCCLYYLKCINPDATPKDIFEHCCILMCGFNKHDCYNCLMTDIEVIKFVKIEPTKEVPASPSNGQITLEGVKARPSEHPLLQARSRGVFKAKQRSPPRNEQNVGNTKLAYEIIKKALEDYDMAYSMDVAKLLPGSIEAAASTVSRVFKVMLRQYSEHIRKTRMSKPDRRTCNVLILRDGVETNDINWKDWNDLSSSTFAEDKSLS